MFVRFLWLNLVNIILNLNETSSNYAPNFQCFCAQIPSMLHTMIKNGEFQSMMTSKDCPFLSLSRSIAQNQLALHSYISCRMLFELLVLSGAQVGSDWTSILKKRQDFRWVFLYIKKDTELLCFIVSQDQRKIMFPLLQRCIFRIRCRNCGQHF